MNQTESMSTLQTDRVYPLGLVYVLCWVAYNIVTLFWQLLQFFYVGGGFEYVWLATLPASLWPLLLAPFLEFVVAVIAFFALLRSKKFAPVFVFVWTILVVVSSVVWLLSVSSFPFWGGVASSFAVAQQIVGLALAVLSSWYVFKNKSLFIK